MPERDTAPRAEAAQLLNSQCVTGGEGVREGVLRCQTAGSVEVLSVTFAKGGVAGAWAPLRFACTSDLSTSGIPRSVSWESSWFRKLIYVLYSSNAQIPPNEI